MRQAACAISLAAALVGTAPGDSAGIVIEGEAVITETTVPDTAIGDPVAFVVVIDASAPEPSGRTLTLYPDRPFNGLVATSRLGGGAVAHDVRCDGVSAGVWNDDESHGDSVAMAGTSCQDVVAMSPLAGVTIELEDVSQTALAEPLFPDPLLLASFPDARELAVLYDQTTRFRAGITRIPEPASLVAACAALLGIGCVRRARRRIGRPLVLASLLFAGVAADAAPILYTVMGRATGSADGVPFSDADFSIAVSADSSQVTQNMDDAMHGIIVYETPPLPGSIAIEGVGVGLFSDPVAVFANQTYVTAGVTRGGGGGDLLDMVGAAFATLDLCSAFGPVSPSNAYPVYFTGVATSIGSITLASVSDVQFEVVPEGEGLSLAAAAAGTLACLRAVAVRRRAAVVASPRRPLA